MDDAPIMSFPIARKGDVWWLEADLAREFYRAYGRQVNVLAEFEAARMWLVTNPGKRKTKRGMPEFLRRWIERSVNNGTGRPPKSKQETRAEADRMRAAYEADAEQRRRHAAASKREPGDVEHIQNLLPFREREVGAGP